MKLLVTKAHPSLAALHDEHGDAIGRLVVPKDCARVDETAAAGITWAADNAAYSCFDERAFLAMLERIAFVPGCRFVAAPDVVADAKATWALFGRWYCEITARGLPVALVLQDGMTADAFPWDYEPHAFFVGGSSEWKLGLAARELVAAAKERGLWVHMGRVNTFQRIRYARAIGCDSVDGSQWSLWTTTYIAQGVAAVSAPRQTLLESTP